MIIDVYAVCTGIVHVGCMIIDVYAVCTGILRVGCAVQREEYSDDDGHHHGWVRVHASLRRPGMGPLHLLLSSMQASLCTVYCQDILTMSSRY